jgi:hypothetical protein
VLTVFRRHIKSCKHRSRRFRGCQCPLWAEGRLRGEIVRQSLDLRNWEAAQKLVRSWEIDGNHVVPSVAQAGERIVADMRARGLSEDSVAKFERLKDELVAFFGTVSIASISPDDAARFRERWEGRPSTIQKKVERLRSFFKFCVDRDWIEKNQAKGIKYPRELWVPKKPFEKDEVEKIEWAIPLFPIKGIYGEANQSRIRAFTLVLRWTGLRIRDVVRLQPNAVRNSYVVLRAQKNGKPIKILVPQFVIDELRKIENGSGHYFWSGLGNPKSCVGDWQRTLRRLSEISAQISLTNQSRKVRLG